MQLLVQTILAFFFTVVLGTRIAHVWQTRAAREVRFFEASRAIHQQMREASDELIGQVGRRVYAMQRLCLSPPGSIGFDEAREELRAAVLDWNKHLLKMELSVRILFRETYLNTLEELQQRMALTTTKIFHSADGKRAYSQQQLLYEVVTLRHDFFGFAQGMVKEANLLHRQMHFGVKVDYDQYNLEKLSTKDLLKLLFAPGVQRKGVIRTPSDFGTPVSVWEARFGVNE